MGRKGKILALILIFISLCVDAGTVVVYRSETASVRVKFGIEKLEKALNNKGYKVTKEVVGVNTIDKKLLRKPKLSRIFVAETNDSVMSAYVDKCKLGLSRQTKKEGYQIISNGNTILLRGNDATGSLYACLELCDLLDESGRLPSGLNIADQPEMVLRGACIGMQKTYYLPGRTVYEYPYTPENFPWFYDKEMWIKYLDMLLENRMNSLYLWNGHPFASLVKLKDYPFAVEVSDEDFRKNEEIFRFLTEEADKRGIWVIQMFYNIIVSKPFAEHYGIKTQDSNRPIVPLISDYTRKSIAAFIEKYPNVGLLVCLGEAMNTYEDDVQWFTKTIIPGVQDGLKSLGKTEEVPIILRAHDTNCKMDMDSALPLYKNLYTMNKYNGESLVTYEPGGPWAKTHRDLSALGSTHISNVHVLANLEPFRWSSPDFIQKSVKAMHEIHGANALHLYPQASYWDWPYSADKAEPRLLQVDRDWMWYKAWARYAWNDSRDRKDEIEYWAKQLDNVYGCGDQSRYLLDAYEQMGEISPMLTRKFAITEGNRQTFLLGSFMSQLVNPERWRVYPDFPLSCDPGGERLADWVRKEYMGEPHIDNNPLNVINEVAAHADASVEAIEKVTAVTKNGDEFARLKNDVFCMNAFAYCMYNKVKAAMLVMRYDYSKDISDLEKAVPYLESSLQKYKELVSLTKDKYLYANSMQTRQRRVPIGGDDGLNKTWAELLPLYTDELANFEKNIERIRLMQSGKIVQPVVQPLVPADVTIQDTFKLVTLGEVPQMFSDRPSQVVNYAEELKNLKGLRFSFNKQSHTPTEIHFSCNKPVSVLVGYFSTVHTDYLFAPRLETDASANDYGQAEIRVSNAVEIKGQPPVNIHTYTFPAGDNVLNLKKGVALILGFTDGTKTIKVRDAGLGEKTNIDWLFY
jgi:hypothetical protein